MSADPTLGGRYVLGELLGVGGSASVFRAEDLRGPVGESSVVAVKILHPHLCADDATRSAFLREARQVQQLEHPNVIGVHGSGLHDGGGVTMPWIALDYLDGPTLREWVERHGPLSPRAAAIVMDGVLAGLAAAHVVGIVHRDLSPQNIVLDGLSIDGAPSTATPRIVDFGLADVTGRATVGSDVLLSEARGGAAAESSGRVVGNAQFMSPEQAQGLPVRSVSDLYQAGALLSFALTGQPPFRRDTTEQTLLAHVSAPPPVPSAVVSAARPFDRVVTRALSKTPAHRFRTADDFRAALADAAVAVADAAAIARSTASAAAAEGAPSTAATTVLPAVAAPFGYLEPASPAPAPASPASRGPGAGVVAAAIGAIVLGLAGWGVLSATAAAPSPTPTSSSSPAASEPAPSPTGSPTAPSSAPTVAPTTAAPLAPPAPATVAVPGLFGTLGDADRALRAAGLSLGTVTRVESAEAADRVLGQSPTVGADLAPGSAVSLMIASGSNVVPQVSGMSLASATAQLQSAGFLVATDRPAAASSTTVTASQPAAGAVLRVGVTVTVVVASDPTPGSTPGGKEPDR